MIMTLRYMTDDGKMNIVKGVRRAFTGTLASVEDEFLQYETIDDGYGVGTRMSDIRWWSVRLEPAGADIEL